MVVGNILVTKSIKRDFDVTVPHNYTTQVLVQRKNNKVKDVVDLKLKTIHVTHDYAIIERLNNLMGEIGDTIYVKETDEPSEFLIAQVANGTIDYTIADVHLAKLLSSYYDNLDCSIKVGFTQEVSWVLRKGSNDLVNQINVFLSYFKNTQRYKQICRKYFENNKFNKYTNPENYVAEKNQISKYDNIIKEY